MSKATLLVVLLAAGAAFGMGYVVGTSGQPTTSLDEDEIPVEDARVRAKSRNLLSGSEGPELTGNAVEANPGVRSLVASFPVPERETGTSKITGTVKTAAGEPVEGVKITGTPNLERQRRPQLEDEDEQLVQMVQWQLEWSRWRQANQVKTMTGADGSFAFDDLTDKKHSFQAKLDGWRISSRGSSNVEAGGTIEFQARRVTGIQLEVYGPDGAEIEKASLSFRTGRRNRGSSWSAKRKDKLAEVKPGSYDLYVEAGEHKELRAGPIEVEVREDETEHLRVDLELRPVLVVKVEFPEGEASQGQIYTMPVSGTDAPTNAVLRARGKNESMYRRGRRGTGEYTRTFSDLLAGRLAVGFARGHNGSFEIIEVVDVVDGVNDLALKVPPLDANRYAVVRVTGPDGKPVPDASISTGYRLENGGSSSGGSTLIKRPNGEYYVLDHGHSFDKGGTYWIDVSAGNFGTKRVEYGQGDSRVFHIRFEPPASAHIAIQNIKSLVDGQTLQVSLNQGTRGGSSENVDEKGTARFRSLQPGKYTLSVSIGARHWPAQVHTEELTISAGKNNVSVTLPPLYSVTVRGAQSHVWLQRIEEGKRHRGMHRNVQAADGEAVVDALPAGKYRASSNNGKTAEFTVPGTRVVTLQEPERK